MADNDLIRKTSVSKFYRAWVNMKSRCDNPKTIGFSRYGGRGITYCKEWASFDGFIRDMLQDYQSNLTLDRIDNNGNYCKSNCRWVTPKEQARNTKNVETATRFTFNGVNKTIREWAEYIGIKRKTLSMRLLGYNWPIEKALIKGGQIGRF